MFRNHIKFLNMVEINFPSKFTVLTMQSICYFLPISTFVDDYLENQSHFMIGITI